MEGVRDLVSVQQTATQLLAALQETQAQLVPSASSGHLDVDTLVQSGFVRVLGVSVIAGSGTPMLHDAAALADAASTNAVYAIPVVAGYYATNMVFTKGLVMAIGTATEVAIFYTRI